MHIDVIVERTGLESEEFLPYLLQWEVVSSEEKEGDLRGSWQ